MKNAEDRSSDKSSNLELIIDSILENMKLVIGGSQTLSIDMFRELVNVVDAAVELPRELEVCDPEIEITSDIHGRWCIVKGKLRGSKMEWSDYEGFLKAYRHIVEGGVKGLYCRYRLKGDEFVNRTCIIPPLVNGFASDPRTSTHDPTRNLVYDNAQAFQIINVNQDRDSVPILMNPVLADLVVDTQEFLLNAGDAGLELRTWVERFIGRKDQFMRFAMRCIYGRNNVIWERCPHPRMVGRWLNILPNFNRISIPYALKFIGPLTNTRPLNVTTAIAALDVNAANASVIL